MKKSSYGNSTSQSSLQNVAGLFARTNDWSQRCCEWLCLSIKVLTLVVMLYSGDLQAQPQTGPAKQSFVPVDQMEAIFERSPNGVLLPREEFQQLLSRAQQADAAKADVPVSIVKRTAVYDVRQQGKHAIVRLSLEMEQFADEWLAIKIPVGNLQIEKATIDDEPAAVSRLDNQPGLLYLAHRKPGPFALELTMSTPLATVGSDSIAAFRMVPAMAATLKVACPEDLQLQFNDLKLNRPAPLDQETEYLIPSGNVDQVRLKWTSQQQSAEAKTLVFARTDAQLRLSRDDIRWTSNSRVSIFGSAINQLVIRVPSNLEVTSVDSAGLESWKMEDDSDKAGATRVLLNYRQPFSQDRVVKLSAVAPVTGGDTGARLPTLQFIDITSHTGRLFVQHEDQLRLLATVGGGVRQLGTSTTAGKTESGEIFDFWLQDFNLSVAVKPRDREVFAEVNSSLAIVDTLATFRCEATIETLNAPLFELMLQLPTDWQISSVTGEDGSRMEWRNGNSANQILVTPETPTAAGGLLSVTVNLSQSISDPADVQTLALPVVVAEDALLVGGTYEISGAQDLAVSPIEINGLSPIGAEDGQVLFETQGVTYSGKVTIVRKPIRLSSRSVIRSWMDTRQKTVNAVVTVDVLNGTTRTLQIQVAESLGEDVRFSVQSIAKVPGWDDQQVPASVAIVEQTSKLVGEGVRNFDLTFDKRFVGAVTLETTIKQPLSEDATLSAMFFGVTNAIRQHGLVVFEAYPEQQLTAATDIAESGLQIADAGLVEAPSAISGRRIALVYRYVQPKYVLELEEQRFDTQVVPSAVCEQMANISLLSQTGSIQRFSKTSFRCVGVQTLRFTLPDPDQSYLWSTVLNGQAVGVRRDEADYLVAIPTDSSRTQHQLEILFETSVVEKSLLGNTQQQSISLSIDSEQGQALPIDILEQTWDVRYPATAMLMNHDGDFSPIGELEQPGWLQQIGPLLQIPTSRVLANQGFSLAICLLVLFVVTTLIVRRRWKTLACICLTVAVAIPLTLGNSRVASRMSKSTDSQAKDFDDAVVSNAVTGGIRLGEDEAAHMFETEPQAGPSMPGGGDKQAAEMFGGMGGGGYGGGMGAIDGFEGEVAELQSQQPSQRDNLFNQPQRMNVPQAEFRRQMAGQPPPLQVIQNGQNADPFSETDAITLNGAMIAKPSGTARLSVRAAIANPNDYKSMRFRSIGGTPAAGQLQVTVQPHSRMNAMRLIVAAIITLLCLMISRVKIVRRFASVVCLCLISAAAAPLVPNEWQPAVDGIACGAAIGVALWVLLGVCRSVQGWFGAFQSGSRFRLSRSKRIKTAGLMLIVSSLAAAVVADETSKLSRPEIVMPYTPGQPELLADQVFLPQEEFLKLYELAYPKDFAAPSALSESRVVAAYYTGTDRRQIQDASWSQSFTVRYVIRSYSKRSVEVTLPIGDVAVISAKLDGEDAILVANTASESPQSASSIQQQVPSERQVVPQQVQQFYQAKRATAANSGYAVRIPSAGVKILDVVFEVPATIENSVGKLSLPLRPVAVGTVVFELPEDNAEAKVNGRSNVFRSEGKTLTIPIASAGTTLIEWKPTATQNASDTIFHSSVNSALIMDDRGLTLKSTLSLNCRQGQVSEVQLTIPSGYSVQAVEGRDIAGWNVSEDDTANLTFVFRQPIDGETRVQLSLFRREIFGDQDQTVELPIPSVMGASRDSGTITVLAGRELEVRVDALSGVSQVNVSDVAVPDAVDKTLRKVLAWRYTRHPVAVSVRVYRAAESLKIQMLNGVQLEPQRQLWTTLISATISGAPRRRLEIAVPVDYLALDVAANDLADWYYSESSDGSTDQRILNIQFQKARLGKVSAVIQGQTSRSEDELAAKIVAPQVLNADECSTSVSLWLDASSEIASVDTNGWKRAGRDVAIDRRILNLQTDAPDISLQSNDVLPSPVGLTLRKAEASLNAESVFVTTVTDTSVELMLALKWKISGAPTRSVSFLLPGAMIDVYDFQIPGLRQLQKSIQGDSVRVTVHLQQPVSESLFVLGTGTLPLPDSQQVSPIAPQFVIEEDGSSKVASQSHFWVIVNQSAGLLETTDSAADGEDTDADEISTTIPELLLQQAVAIRRLRLDRRNSSWQLKFPARQKVAPAVVALAAHVSVVAQDSTWRSLHTLQVRNESRQFLPVILPTDSRVLFCLVKGQPTRVVTRTEGDQLLHLIPIPQSGEISVPFEVQFSIAGQLPDILDEIAGQAIEVPCPVIPEYRDFPGFGVTISRNTWQVYVPEAWQASMISDPRKTNVVAASQEDLADVRLMCSVDNMKSMISAASATGLGLGGSRVLQELQRQQLDLQDIVGNASQAESERNKALLDANKLLGRQYSGQQGLQTDVEFEDSTSIMGGIAGSNIYLQQQEATQNTLNNTNRLQIIEGNGGDGFTFDGGASSKFNFELPALLKDSNSRSPQAPVPSRDIPAKSKAPAKKSGNSKLLERRQSNQLQSLQELGKNLNGQNNGADPSFGSPAVPSEFPSFGSRGFSLPNAAGGTIDGNLRVQRGLDVELNRSEQLGLQGLGLVILKGNQADVESVNAMVEQQRRSQISTGQSEGLLSLQFRIPEAGIRHDFIRTGGNANLTLRVRSQKIVGRGIGIGWAVFCVVLAFVLLRGASKGGQSLLTRLLMLVTLVGLVGSLCTTGSIQDVCCAVCLVAAVLTSVVVVASSIRKPITVVG